MPTGPILIRERLNRGRPRRERASARDGGVPPGHRSGKVWEVVTILLTGLVLLVIGYLVSSRLSNGVLQEALAETDRLSPGWRLEDLEAERRQVPDERNAALLVLAVDGLDPLALAGQVRTRLRPPRRDSAPRWRVTRQAHASRPGGRPILEDRSGRLEAGFGRCPRTGRPAGRPLPDLLDSRRNLHAATPPQDHARRRDLALIRRAVTGSGWGRGPGALKSPAAPP